MELRKALPPLPPPPPPPPSKPASLDANGEPLQMGIPYKMKHGFDATNYQEVSDITYSLDYDF